MTGQQREDAAEDCGPGCRVPAAHRDALPTADQLEAVFYAALKAQDFEGVMAALQVMIGVDSARALRLHESLQEAVNLAQMLNRIGSEARHLGGSNAAGDPS